MCSAKELDNLYQVIQLRFMPTYYNHYFHVSTSLFQVLDRVLYLVYPYSLTTLYFPSNLVTIKRKRKKVKEKYSYLKQIVTHIDYKTLCAINQVHCPPFMSLDRALFIQPSILFDLHILFLNHLLKLTYHKEIYTSSPSRKLKHFHPLCYFNYFQKSFESALKNGYRQFF